MLRKLAVDMGVPMSQIESIAVTASHRYKVYRIAKRKGGTREICHPAKELKSLQRWIADNVFTKFPVHDSVYSYRAGRGIRDHAELHRKQNYLLRIDFKDFFPSITIKDVARLIVENRSRLPSSLKAEDVKNICRIVCRFSRLSIGAPSSPVISNAVLYAFDEQWSKICANREIVYSRYADDIYLSTNVPDVLAPTYKEIRNDVEQRAWPKLQINRQKVVFTSRKHNRNVTGLILTSDRRISIGHEKKRWLRSQVHKFSLGQLSESDTSHLRGYLSYVWSVEPSLLRKLGKKYGTKIMRQIAKSELIIRKSVKSKKRLPSIKR